MALMIPTVAGPLSELSQSVRIQDQRPGAFVTVFSRSITHVIARGTAPSADERFPLLPGVKLQRGDLLFAVQDFDGVRSAEPSGDQGQLVAPGATGASDLGHVELMTRPYECGEYVWVEGVLPGASVSLSSGPTILGSGIADEGVAVFKLTTPVPAPTSLRCFQSIPGLGSGPDTLQDSELLPPPSGLPLPAPQIQPPLRGCDTAISVSGVIDGATVTCERRSGLVEQMGFFSDSDTVNLSRPLAEDDEITLSQNVSARCDRRSNASDPITVGPLEPLDPPRVRSPLCAGATVVRVTGLRRGALVHLSANGEVYDGTAPAGRDWLDCRIPPLTGDAVSATQEMCGVVSAASVAVDVDPHEEFVPPPSVIGPLYRCGRSVAVTNIHAGALVQVFARSLHGDGPISEQVLVLHTNAVIDVQPALRQDDDVYVRQRACSNMSHSSGVEPVVLAPQIDAVDVVGMLFEGSNEVHVRGALPGSKVEVSATPPDGTAMVLLGRAWADPLHPLLVVGTSRPLQDGDTVSARQVFCGHPSEGGLQVRVDRAPQSGPRPFYVIAHNPNSLTEAFQALGEGANALEPDVNIYSSTDALCINEAGLSGKKRAGSDSSSLVDYLTGLHHFAEIFPHFALVIFDCKTPAAASHPENGFGLLMAVRKHLTYDNDLNVIISIGDRSDGQGEFFDRIIDILGPREGLAIDSENDAGAISNYFTSREVEHQGYGNGTSVINFLGMLPYRYSLEAACGIRAMAGRPRFVYVWTINGLLAGDEQREYIRIGVDGIITDNVPTLLTTTWQAEFYALIRPATRLYNPMQPDNFSYGILVHTSDQDHAGTDANVTFTITGSAGSASKTVNTELIKRMERDCWNYVTIPSPDLGNLLSMTVRRDNAGNAPDWHLDGITVTSARYKVSAKAYFNRWIDSTDPFIAPFV